MADMDEVSTEEMNGPKTLLRAVGAPLCECRHSGAMRSIEPGISRFPDAQLRICGLVLRTIPE